jgi:hypothetical protein
VCRNGHNGAFIRRSQSLCYNRRLPCARSRYLPSRF